MSSGGPGPLAGCRVVEVGAGVAVASCGSLLAQLGAEVVLVEPHTPGSGHKWADRAVTAAGKRSVVVDPQDREDVALLRRCVAEADVVLLSSDLSELDRELWHGPRPARQVRCDITAFGHDGPLAGVPASEAALEARAGVAETTGRRDGPPALLGAPLLEMEAAVYAASAVLAALRVRRRHGFGQRVEIAVYDVGVNSLSAFIPLQLVGRTATRNGNHHPTLSPWNAYHAQDGWVLICAPTEDQWSRLCAAMQRTDLVHDPRFSTASDRMDNAEEIDAVIGPWVAARSVAECVDVLTRHVIPSGPIVPVDDLGDEPNLRHRGMIRLATDPGTGRRVRLPGCPIQWRGPEPEAEVPARDADRAAVAAGAGGTGNVPAVTGDPASPIRPLEGVRVVEIGMNTVGPLAGRQLGALGADVIKVEPPRGDYNRRNPPLRPDGLGHVFAMFNTDKRSLVLDLREEEDRELLWDVLASADVLIENLKPGSLGRLGLGPAQVRARAPHLVYCSMNGFGHDTAYPDRPALDTVVQAVSGLMGATLVDGVPTKAGISISDQLGGLFGMLGVLAALEQRETVGGPGLTLDIAMQDGSAWASHRRWNTDPDPEPRITVTGDRAELHENGVRTPVATVAEVLAHPQTAARQLVLERPSPDGDTWTVLGSPMRLRSTPAEVRAAMPRLGVLDPALAAEFGLTTGPDGRSRRSDARARTEV